MSIYFKRFNSLYNTFASKCSSVYISRVFPEKIIFDIFKKYGNYSRVIAIDTNLVNVKSRLKKFIAIAGAPRDDYYIKLDVVAYVFLHSDTDVCRTVIFVFFIISRRNIICVANNGPTLSRTGKRRALSCFLPCEIY